MKYTFPLDQDEIQESDYLQLNEEKLSENQSHDYIVSMSTTHSYVLAKEDNIEDLLSIKSSGSND